MNLDKIVRDYIDNFRPYKQREHNFFRRQKTFEMAIKIAARAEDEGGKRYSHQRRIKRKAIDEAENFLLNERAVLENSQSFHELWLNIKIILGQVAGIGDLYMYDTALRVGYFLRILPEKVYLHAGTRIGAQTFELKPQNPNWIEVSELPIPFRKLPPYEVEDLLCIYKKNKEEAGQPKGCTK